MEPQTTDRVSRTGTQDDILADFPVECGHCHSLLSLLPAGGESSDYGCLTAGTQDCASVRISAPGLAKYAAENVLAELAKPDVRQHLIRALHPQTGVRLPQPVREIARLVASDMPDNDLDEAAFTVPWVVAWWKRVPVDRQKALCRSFLTKIEVHQGLAPAPDALHDDRIVLHWHAWDLAADR